MRPVGVSATDFQVPPKPSPTSMEATKSGTDGSRCDNPAGTPFCCWSGFCVRVHPGLPIAGYWRHAPTVESNQGFAAPHLALL